MAVGRDIVIQKRTATSGVDEGADLPLDLTLAGGGGKAAPAVRSRSTSGGHGCVYGGQGLKGFEVLAEGLLLE